MLIAAATCGCVASIAVALAAVYAWHRLRGPVPLVAWAARLCARPRRDDAAKLEEVLTELKVPKNGVVQVTRRRLLGRSWQSMLCKPSLFAKSACGGKLEAFCACFHK